MSLVALDQCLASSHQIDGKRVDPTKAADGKEENEEVLRAKVYDPEAPDLKKLRVSSLNPGTSEEIVDPDSDAITRGAAALVTSPTSKVMRRVLEEINNKIEPLEKKKKLEIDLLLTDSEAEEEKENSGV